MFAPDFFGEGYYASDYFPPSGDGVVIAPGIGGGDDGADQVRRDYIRREHEIREQERIDAIMMDDQEIIEMVCMLVSSGIFDNL